MSGNATRFFRNALRRSSFCLDRVCFGLLRCDHRADIFHEVDSTFFAVHAGALFVAARRALETHGHVATLAEARHLAHGGAAFRAGNCGLRDWRCRWIPGVRVRLEIWAASRWRVPSAAAHQGRRRRCRRFRARQRLRALRIGLRRKRSVRRDVGRVAVTVSRR